MWGRLSENLQNVEEKETEKKTLDLTCLELVLGAIQADGSWAAVTDKSKVRSYVVPVNPNTEYIIETSSVNNYTVVNTLFDTTSAQPQENIDYASGYTGRVDVAAATSIRIEIPSDGHYLFVRADLTGGAAFVPTIKKVITAKEQATRLDNAVLATRVASDTSWKRQCVTVKNNVLAIAPSPNWGTQVMPINDIVEVNVVAQNSLSTEQAPCLIYLRGEEVTQENYISAVFGQETITGRIARLDTHTFFPPAGATHVLVQTLSALYPDTYIVRYDIDYLRQEVERLKLRDLTTVDINGHGDYTSIADAVDGTSDGDTIVVYPGTYEESVHAFGKDRHIVGVCKDTCILINGTGNYDTPPLEMNIGSIENMTIIADNYAPTIPDPSENHNHAAYGIHIEYANADPYTIRISNCKIVSKWSAGIGLGLRYNQTVIIDNCELISECVRIWSEWSNIWVEMGGLFFHNDAASNIGGTGKLRVKDTILRGEKAALVMESVENKVGTVDAEFIGGTLASEDYGVGNGVIYRWPGTTTPEGYLCGSKITLAITAHGNNIAELNA